MKKEKYSLIGFALAMTLTNSAQAAGYCMALRGNGELEPAHWGAMAATVERLGLPDAMAGGSSSTISMFLLESMALNSEVQKQTDSQKAESVSLMLKSLMGVTQEVLQSKPAQDFQMVYGEYRKTESKDLVVKLQTLLQGKNFDAALNVLNVGVRTGLVSDELVAMLAQSLKNRNYAQAQFNLSEVKTAIETFGSFDPTNDNLFFRPGLISFEKLAVSVGRIAGFYSNQNKSAALSLKWQSFFSSCAINSKNLSWPQIITQRPACASIFHDLYQTYFSNESADGHAEERIAGSVIPTFSSTSIIRGTSAKSTLLAMKAYQTTTDLHFGKNFRAENSEDVRFGYWGAADQLQRISANLPKNDEKSRRFMALGAASWKKIISYSPAEPGLSPLKVYQNGSEQIISAGGWSDLHPTLILKAFGCEQIVYLTRKGGDSPFAQVIAKRLLGEKADTTEQSPLLSSLFNLANPNSSFVKSLQTASAVMCTNWNDFDIKKDFQALVEDSYRASYKVSAQARPALVQQLENVTQDKALGCTP